MAAGDAINEAAAQTADAAKGIIGKIGTGVKNVAMTPINHPKKTAVVVGACALGGIAGAAMLAAQTAGGAAATGIGLAGTTSLPFNAAGVAAAAGTTSSVSTAAAATAAPQGVLSAMGSAIATGAGHVGNGAYLAGVNGWEIVTAADWSMVGQGLAGGGEAVAGAIGPGTDPGTTGSIFTEPVLSPAA